MKGQEEETNYVLSERLNFHMALELEREFERYHQRKDYKERKNLLPTG